MAAEFEADVALLHIAGGDARVSPPPGTLALAAPRRAARGRAEDMLFLSLSAEPARPGAPGPLDGLARQAAQVYFGTPGTITAALREAAAEVNRRLLEANQRGAVDQLEGRLMAAILRGSDLYLAQSGSGLGALIRPGQVSRFSSDEASARPLGTSVAPNVRFHHTRIGAGDLVLLTTALPTAWSDTALAGLSDLQPAQAVERLVATAQQDLTGVLFRIASSGGAAKPAAAPAVVVGDPHSSRPAPARRSASRRPPTSGERDLRNLLHQLRLPLASIGRWLAGALPAPRGAGSALPAGWMAATAIAVPLVVVAIVSVVYLRRGRVEQYRQFLNLAQTAVVAAQLKPSLDEARPDWEAASQWLSEAARYGSGEESNVLAAQVREALDRLDNIQRVGFAPAVGGGLGSGARLRAVAATSGDLYIYDEGGPEILHAWFTGRGYEIDRDFQCLAALRPIEVGRIVDLLVQPDPGALGTQGIVAIDQSATLIYCAPGVPPATGQLSPPSTGWGQLTAVDLTGDRLYVLDSKANQVWIYGARDGLFAGAPALYFTEVVQSLNHAVDLAVTQDELIVLHDDGLVDVCRRPEEKAPDGSLRIRIECQKDLRVVPEGITLTSVTYSPPPEPSLFFLDSIGGVVYHYSVRLVYQGQYVPTPELPQSPLDLAVGPPRDLYLIVGDQVYFAQPTP